VKIIILQGICKSVKKGGVLMASNITNYKCPACTGPLQFSGASGKLECEYCGSSYEIAMIEQLYAEKEQKAIEVQQEIDA
jgi:uncharacterized Zn finger protein (UPF0148 family)